jgi:hypothetical protein
VMRCACYTTIERKYFFCGKAHLFYIHISDYNKLLF